MGRVRTITDTDDRIEEIDGTAYPEHPLFPLIDGEKSFDTSYVQITRIENGIQKWGPVFPAAELMSEREIFERWGGGQYVIVARAAAKMDGVPGRIKKHRRLTLPGKSKPLSEDPTPEEKNLANPQPPPAPAPQNGSSDLAGMFGLMMQMQQQSAERAAAQSQQFLQMFMAMMQNGKSDAQAMTQMMLQMSSQSQASMMGLISTVMSNRGGGPEEMAKYADLLRSLGVGGSGAKEGEKPASESIGSMLENAADVIQGMVALKGVQPGQQAGVAPAMPDPAALAGGDGGAAAVLRGMGQR